jgi:hypothetical protein
MALSLAATKHRSDGILLTRHLERLHHDLIQMALKSDP